MEAVYFSELLVPIYLRDFPENRKFNCTADGFITHGLLCEIVSLLPAPVLSRLPM
jgi:hypothetical protein